MMVYAYLPIHFWGEALSTTTYILNRVETKTKSLTPCQNGQVINQTLINSKCVIVRNKYSCQDP